MIYHRPIEVAETGEEVYSRVAKFMVEISESKDKLIIIVKSLITGSFRGQDLYQTIQYIEDNVIGEGAFYLPEAQTIYFQQQDFAKGFIYDLND